MTSLIYTFVFGGFAGTDNNGVYFELFHYAVDKNIYNGIIISLLTI